MRTWLVLACLFMAVSALGKEPPAFDPGAEPLLISKTFLEVDKPKALTGLRRVAIANFRVEFAVENNGKAQSSSSVGATSVKADILLHGIDDATRQAITDHLYDTFVARLTAAGIEVIPYESLAANADYQSLGPRFKKTFDPVGTQIGKSVFVGPHAMPIYFTNDDKHLGVAASFGSLSTTQPQNIEPQIAKSLDAAVLRVTMNIQFAEQNARGGFFRNESSVESNLRLAFFPQTTQVLVVTPASGRSRITLEEPITLEGGMLSLEDDQSRGEKTAEAIGNVITGLATGITRKVKRYNANSEPAAYAAGIERYGDAYYNAVAQTLHANSGA